MHLKKYSNAAHGLFLFICLQATIAPAQFDHVGSGRALRLNGGNYVDLGNIYDDLTLPVTISAWVWLAPASPTANPIFASQENADLYNGIQMFVQPNAIIFEYGDGQGNNSPAFRKGKIATFDGANITSRWVHVCGVMNTAADIQIYINGIDVGGALSGSSSFPMASNYPTDVAMVGKYLSNGVNYQFNGDIDELRVWHRALSASEVRDGMCKKLSGTESGLIGYWKFDETSGNTVFDSSPNGYDGTLRGPLRVFSGAPVGDASVYSYPGTWVDNTISLAEGTQELTVSNVKGNPAGAHLYVVRETPSQIGELNPVETNEPYFGCYLASLDQSGSFDGNFSSINFCRTNKRMNNSESDWTEIVSPFTIPFLHSEVLQVVGLTSTINLGRDTITCEPSLVIDSKIDPPTGTLVWNTGQTGSTITINRSGVYWAQTSGCNTVRDSLVVIFVIPGEADLGPDYIGCSVPSARLVPLADSVGFRYTWHDGSHGASFQPKDFGTIWVIAKNACGTTTDTVSYSRPVAPFKIPDVFTPNNDTWNDFFVVDGTDNSSVSLRIYNRWGKQVFQADNYKNDWDGDGPAPGVYFIVVSAGCAQTKNSLSIIR